MPCLYVNTKGEPHYKHSYTAGNDYDQSPLKYYLRRVMGWKPKDTKAAFPFGRAIEKSVEFYHDNNGHGIVEKFIELWAPTQAEKLIYSKTEKDWASLNRAGQEMMKLYIIRQPSLPIPLGGASVFQREYAKEVFPNDSNYGDIFDAGKLDIVSYVDPKHPALPKIEWKPEFGLLCPLLTDMKTSGVDLPDNPGIAAFDKQLRRYSWQSGIRIAALLWFVKKGHTYKKGSRITLLEDVGDFKAGTEVYVADTARKDPVGAYFVSSKLMITEMERIQGKKADGKLDTTKAAVTKKDEWVDANAFFVPESKFTRQRLQFNIGYISEESARGAGHIAARQITQIVSSWKSNNWPDTFGIRFPADDRNDPYFRAFVLRDEAFKSEHFIQNEEEDLFDEDVEPDVEPEAGE